VVHTKAKIKQIIISLHTLIKTFQKKRFVIYKRSDITNIKLLIQDQISTSQTLPSIVNLAIDNASFSIILPPRWIRIYENVKILPHYSFIFKDNIVEIPKFNSKITCLKSRVAEHIFSIDAEKLILIDSNREEVHSDCAISLAGHYSEHFGHFLLEYLERLNPLENVGIKQIDVILNEDVDRNILDLILSMELSYKINILLLKQNQYVVCKKYYHVDPHAIVCDGAFYASITDKLYYPSFRNFYKSFSAPKKIQRGRKLFLTRSNKRNISNIREIEEYFAEHGYEIVENCHTMTINEKKTLFSDASYVVGPGGSAFFNCIWCPVDVHILCFFNYEIAYDNVLQNMLSNQAKIYHLAGKETKYEFYNSQYDIPLEEVVEFSKELGFL
jgi:hypothetical protein